MESSILCTYIFSIAVGRTGTSSEHVDQHVYVLPSQEAKIVWLVSICHADFKYYYYLSSMMLRENSPHTFTVLDFYELFFRLKCYQF